MNKKTYQKPKMRIYSLIKQTPLLAGSDSGGGNEPGTYIPRINEEMNKLT